MRNYEILDEDTKRSIGVLIYYEKQRTFIVELEDDLDEWNCPLLFTEYVKRGIFTMPRDVSFLWVKERVIPSGRQNIQSILKTHKLKEYDEMKFLELSQGRCSQDYMYIRKIDNLPEYVVARQRLNLLDTMVLDGNKILSFFADNSVKIIDLNDFLDISDVSKVISNRMLFESCMAGSGGYYLTFNDSIDIPAAVLYERGETVPFGFDIFLKYVRKNIVDTSECCDLLDCSRQNLSYLVKQNRLTPVKENVKGNLYVKGDVIRNMW